MKWISVKDRLPFNGDRVMLYSERWGYKFGWYQNKVANSHYWNFFAGSGQNISADFTHWQPLPEPPKEHK